MICEGCDFSMSPFEAALAEKAQADVHDVLLCGSCRDASKRADLIGDLQAVTMERDMLREALTLAHYNIATRFGSDATNNLDSDVLDSIEIALGIDRAA